MKDASTHDLIQRLEALLEPGEIDLSGIIVHTGLGSDDEIELYNETLHIGEVIADAAAIDDWYVYSGNDNPEFASNQHQGLQLADDGFVWECQHLLRHRQFVIVMYYESSAHKAVVEELRHQDYDVTAVPPIDSERLSHRTTEPSK